MAVRAVLLPSDIPERDDPLDGLLQLGPRLAEVHALRLQRHGQAGGGLLEGSLWLSATRVMGNGTTLGELLRVKFRYI